jgi:hypothetical protein
MEVSLGNGKISKSYRQKPQADLSALQEMDVMGIHF